MKRISNYTIPATMFRTCKSTILVQILKVVKSDKKSAAKSLSRILQRLGVFNNQ